MLKNYMYKSIQQERITFFDWYKFCIGAIRYTHTQHRFVSQVN